MSADHELAANRSLQKIPDELSSFRRQDAFRMELHSFDRQFPVAQTHDDGLTVLLASRRYLQLVGKALLLDDERVIAVRNHRRSQPLKDCASVMFHHAGLAVHDAVGANYSSAECRPDRLMSETDAQYGNFPGKLLDQLNRDSRLVGRAGAGRDHDLARMQFAHLVHGDLIIATNLHLFSGLANVLHEIEGERIVVVENEDHKKLLSCSAF